MNFSHSKMINGLKVTEIPLVQSHLQSHRKKLLSIATKKFSLAQNPPTQKQQDPFFNQNRSHHSHSLSQSRQKLLSGMTPDEHLRYEKTKHNHLKSVSFHKLQKQSAIEHQNSLIYQKLLRIKKRKDNNNLSQVDQSQQQVQTKQKGVFEKPQRKMGKDFVYRKKQFMAIQSTNVEIGHRILNQTGYYSHEKDEEDFNKTRQLLNRMKRFGTVQRMMNKSMRSKTMPSKLPRLKTQFTQSMISQNIAKIAHNPTGDSGG